MPRSRRDLTAATDALQAWFAGVTGQPAVVSELAVPKAGFSNETIVGRLDGDAGTTEFVVRVEPTGHQLFLDPDVAFQARMLRALAPTGLPVPRVLYEERDPSVLGAPFFVMERVRGRVPTDTPTWHAGGWTFELEPERRGRLYENGVVALTRLHTLDWHDGFEFLGPAGTGSPLDGYLDHVGAWYEWLQPSLRFQPEVLARALAFVRDERPAELEAVVTWGDARVGNMIFGDDLGVVALLDWEGATLAPAGVDVGWWLMFEDFFSVEQGTPRLEGVAGPDETLARYEELSGRTIGDPGYYLILAGLVFSMINSRLADLYISQYGADPAVATAFVDRSTRMTAAWLAAR